jgi:hypothetical protein
MEKRSMLARMSNAGLNGLWCRVMPVNETADVGFGRSIGVQI